MKEFFVENWFRFAILILFLLAILIGAYYLYVYSPAIQEKAKIENLNYERQSQALAGYNEQCAAYEAENRKANKELLDSVTKACNQQNDPSACFDLFMKNQAGKFAETGSDYINACVQNMIAKYGSN